jgi:hypothetical protein
VAGEIRIAFRGARSRRGALTLGQRNVLRSMRHQETDGHNFTLALDVDVPPGLALPAVVAAVRELILRHESLRTTYPDGADGEQLVAGSGELVAQVCEVSIVDHTAVLARLTAARVEPGTELPVRVAVMADRGTPVRVVLVLSHVAVDAAGLEVLRRELTRLLAGHALAPARWQPLDQAVRESTEDGQRRANRAVDYWRDRLLRAPQCMLAVPEDVTPGRAAYRSARLRSTELAWATSVVASRAHASRPATVLAALCAVVGHHVGQRRCVVTTIAGNRHEPELRDYVGPLAQDGLVYVDLPAGSFDTLVRRVFTASMNAYRHSRFDALALWQTIGDIGRERGISFARDLVFNDLSGYAPGVGSAPLPDSEFAWLPAADLPARLVCYVNRLDSQAEIVVWADARRLPQARLELVVRGLRRLLVEASARDVLLAELGSLTGLEPVARGPQWRLVDGCWVDLDEVRRLLRDALPAHLSSADDVDGQLVGFVAAADLTPADAHRACMALLPGRETAMAPRRYVICAPPPDGDWSIAPVLGEGSGRSG